MSAPINRLLRHRALAQRGRTYVVTLWTGGSLSASKPLGTVVAPGRRVAAALAHAYWPEAGSHLRVITAAAAPRELLGRALALDTTVPRRHDRR